MLYRTGRNSDYFRKPAASTCKNRANGPQPEHHSNNNNLVSSINVER